MNYEEKYKEALEAAKKVYHDHRKDRYWRDWLTKLFPELKESKDEIMRENLYKCLRCYVPNDKAEEFIAWLEKHKGD